MMVKKKKINIKNLGGGGGGKIQDTRLYLTNFGPSKGIQRCCTENRRGNPNQR